MLTVPVTPSGPTVTTTVAFSTVVIASVPLISIVEAALYTVNPSVSFTTLVSNSSATNVALIEYSPIGKPAISTDLLPSTTTTNSCPETFNTTVPLSLLPLLSVTVMFMTAISPKLMSSTSIDKILSGRNTSNTEESYTGVL